MTEEFDVFRPTPAHPSGLDARTYVASLPRFCIPEEQILPRPAMSDTAIHQGIAVTGGGLMGVSISAAFIKSGIPVLMYDVAPEVLATAPTRVAAELALQMPQADSTQLFQTMSLFETSDDPRRLARFDLIVESIYEKSKIKQKHYVVLDSVRDRGGYILSNTSTIRIGKLAEVFKSKCNQLTDESFCGFHFFHPVRKRSLLEIIRGPSTSVETLALAVATARLIGKTPIIVHDGPGFLVNRLLNPYLNEALVLLEEGVEPEQIESVCRRFGMQMGPFRIMDEIGLDVTLHSGWSIRNELPDAVTAETILAAMIEDRRLGRKNGRGFYAWQTTQTQWADDGQFDPTLEKLLRHILVDHRTNTQYRHVLPDSEIALRMFLPVLMEAGRIVQDGIVPTFRQTDAALTLGLGFPADRGGICFWAESFGLAELLRASARRDKLGRRYSVPDILMHAADSGTRLIQEIES